MRDSFTDLNLQEPFAVNMPAVPYPGLRPFHSHEWPIFFGREIVVDEIIEMLLDRRVVVVHGDSGSGKSSVVRAGVLVQLQQGNAAGGRRWRTCATIPRIDPLGHLANALSLLLSSKPNVDTATQIREILQHGVHAPELLSMLLRKNDNDRFCILIDQFEELLGIARERVEADAQKFVDVLTGLWSRRAPGLFVILTMRSEFLGGCSRFSGFPEMLNHTQYLLRRLDTYSLTRAIQEPAKLYGSCVTDELTKNLIAQTRDEDDQLPLIQHGLNRLWVQAARAEGAKKSLVSPLGGDNEGAARCDLAAMLEEHASSICSGLLRQRPSLERVMEHIFRALTDINADGYAIRRPLTVRQLLGESGASETDLRLILGAFGTRDANFVTLHRGGPSEDQSLVDLSHEAFIRAWSRLSDRKDGWIWREFEDGLTWRNLIFQARRFEKDKRDRLSYVAFLERAAWIARLPAVDWCERHGGESERVIKLFGTENYKVFRIWSVIFALLTLAMVTAFIDVAAGAHEGESWDVVMIGSSSYLMIFGVPAFFFTRRWFRGRRARVAVERFFARICE